MPSATGTGTSRLETAERTMLLVRLLEERFQELCNEGKAGDLHFSKGQEAISVGVCSALRDTDYVVTHHRTIAHAIAKGVPLRPLVAELLGKAEGLNGGMAGEMHLSYLPRRFMFSFQLVGTCIPVAAGIAWAVKHHLKTEDIVVVFHGDAATGNAQFHEGLNIATIQNVPLLLVCENNRIAGNIPPHFYLPLLNISSRADSYGIPTIVVTANDVQAVMDAAHEAVCYVRGACKPFLLVCDTARLGLHKQGQGDIRSAAQIEKLRHQFDPLRDVSFEPDVIAALQGEIEATIAEVLAGPDPYLPVNGG